MQDTRQLYELVQALTMAVTSQLLEKDSAKQLLKEYIDGDRSIEGTPKTPLIEKKTEKEDINIK